MIPATMTYCLSNAAPSQSASKLLLSDQNTSSASLQKHPHNVVLNDSPSTTTDAPIFIDLDLLEPDCSAKTGTSTSPIDFAIRADLSNSGSARSIPEDHVSEQILPNSVLHPVSPVPASPRSSSATGDITSSIPHDLSLTPTLISSLPAATDPPITSADHTSLHESDDHVLTPILTHRSPSFKDLPEEVSRLSPSQTSLISLDSNCFDDSSTTHPKDSVVNASFSFLPSIS
ncbi:unnamed protein product [Protopolystoma xenopodis]|uniref:Uncharacterized protein n=1 Tax=Protopolystoma xenopodis TaxID=117903 RepID=A0A448XJE7_9PLAT|nr:unnamed protein product [Protopolystoma xenopodis]